MILFLFFMWLRCDFFKTFRLIETIYNDKTLYFIGPHLNVQYECMCVFVCMWSISDLKIKVSFSLKNSFFLYFFHIFFQFFFSWFVWLLDRNISWKHLKGMKKKKIEGHSISHNIYEDTLLLAEPYWNSVWILTVAFDIISVYMYIAHAHTH